MSEKEDFTFRSSFFSSDTMSSFVWKHFEKTDDGTKSVCTHCGEKLSYKSENTSAMKRHLQAKHTINDEVKPLKRSHSDADEVGEDVKPSLKRRLSATSLTSFVSSQSHEKIIKLLVEMVVDDMLPIATVEHKGFRNLISYLAPTFPIPSWRSITARVEAKYDELKAKAVQLLGGDSCQGVALTTDMWTSIATKGYIGVTAHYIDPSWCLRSLVLSTEAMEKRHTAVNISQRLREISTEWKIADKVEAIVHDNAANMVLAATLLDEELDWGHVACVGHTLQLSINDGLKEATISKMVSIARKIVGHFNHSALACSKLHAVEEQQGRKKLLNLVQDVPTRWNSTFLMLDRLVLLSNAVMAVLDGEKDTSRLKLSGTQWDLAKEVVGVLKPLQMATTVLSMDTNPSPSCVYPVVHGLVNQHLVVRDGDSVPVRKLKERVASDLEERFHLQPAEDADVHVAWLASALDPRFKQLSFLSEQNTSAVWSHLRS